MATMLSYARQGTRALAAAHHESCATPLAAPRPCAVSSRTSFTHAPLAPVPVHGPRQRVVAQGIRRSPVITPDIQIGNGEDAIQIDLFKYLLMQRIVFVGGYINDKMATQIVGALLALEAIDEKEDIRIYINSPGGQPYSVIGVVDAIKSIKPEVQTVALGCVYSYSSLVLAAGTKGKRYAMKNTRIMMTQPMGGSQGDIYQIKKTVEELNAIYQLISKFYMNFTGMDQDRVEKNTCRDLFMTPEIALQGDYTVPPDVVRRYREAGLVDTLTPGPFLKVTCD